MNHSNMILKLKDYSAYQLAVHVKDPGSFDLAFREISRAYVSRARYKKENRDPEIKDFIEEQILILRRIGVPEDLTEYIPSDRIHWEESESESVPWKRTDVLLFMVPYLSTQEAHLVSDWHELKTWFILVSIKNGYSDYFRLLLNRKYISAKYEESISTALEHNAVPFLKELRRRNLSLVNRVLENIEDIVSRYKLYLSENYAMLKYIKDLGLTKIRFTRGVMKRVVVWNSDDHSTWIPILRTMYEMSAEEDPMKDLLLCRNLLEKTMSTKGLLKDFLNLMADINAQSSDPVRSLMTPEVFNVLADTAIREHRSRIGKICRLIKKYIVDDEYFEISKLDPKIIANAIHCVNHDNYQNTMVLVRTLINLKAPMNLQSIIGAAIDNEVKKKFPDLAYIVMTEIFTFENLR